MYNYSALSFSRRSAAADTKDPIAFPTKKKDYYNVPEPLCFPKKQEKYINYHISGPFFSFISKQKMVAVIQSPFFANATQKMDYHIPGPIFFPSEPRAAFEVLAI
jgi:hypothetical protein